MVQYEKENYDLKEDNLVLIGQLERAKGKDLLKVDIEDQKELLSKAKELNYIIKELREENEELRLTVVAKQLDIDNLKKQLADGSSTPLMFAKDITRENFWKLLTRI